MPRFSVITVITAAHNSNAKRLRRCVDSVINQTFSDWELIIAADTSDGETVKRILREYASRDQRIKVKFLEKHLGTAGASNEALSFARSEFVAFLDHDDQLTRDALHEVVRFLNENPSVDLLYTDEDRIDESGTRSNPFFKPDWSPELLMSYNYISHLSVYRRSILQKIGGFRPGFDENEEYDLVLRFSEKTEKIEHIPKLLYSHRNANGQPTDSFDTEPPARRAAIRALEDAAVRRGFDAEVSEIRDGGPFRARYNLRGAPLVSVIIPTRNAALLAYCLSSLGKSTYRNFEVLVVDSSGGNEIKRLVGNYRDRRIMEYVGSMPFNFSIATNQAAGVARGEYLIFLNDDTEVIEPTWIEAMLEHAQRPGVGVVGAKLLYVDGSVQHAGMVVGQGSVLHYEGMNGNDLGYHDLAGVVRNCSAVTGACMMVRRQLFRDQGMFDEALGHSWQDVDFCLRIGEAGYRVVYTPFAGLVHILGASRGHIVDKSPEENAARELFWRRWTSLIKLGDRYYNANLSTKRPFEVLNVESKKGMVVQAVDIARRANDVIHHEGIRSLLRQTAIKVGKREFTVVEHPATMNRTNSTDSADLRKEQFGHRSDRFEFGVNMAGFFTGQFGVASSCRAFATALTLANIPHVLNNVVAPMHGERYERLHLQSFRETNPYAINLIHVNVEAAEWFHRSRDKSYTRNRRNIGIWYWELSEFPDKWLRAFHYYDEIWAASSFTANSISKRSPIPVVKVRYPLVINVNIVSGDIRRKLGIPEDDCVFTFTFDFLSVFERKNPLALLKAFGQAFESDEKALLVLNYINGKTNPRTESDLLTASKGKRLHVLGRHLSESDYLSLLGASDCYVSLHRSEGLGLPMAQAMYLGKPVIATGYSGNMDFMNVNNSLLVKYRLVELERDYSAFESGKNAVYLKGNVWAEPDVEHAAELMRWVYENREDAKKIGQRASTDIRDCLNPKIASAEIKARLEQVYQSFEHNS